MITVNVGTPHYENINGRDYEIVNGVEFLSKYLFPRLQDVLGHYEIKTIGVVGIPGSAKSTTVRFIVDFTRDGWGEENCNAMLTDNTQLAIENMDGRLAQILMIDDAMTHQDARRSMSGNNVTTTEQYMLIRHIANETGRGGVIYAFFLFQHPSGIDIRFRDLCDLIIYKTWYDNCGMEDLIKDDDAIQLLKTIARETAYNDFTYRCYSVGRTRWGDIIYMKTPEVKEEGFKIRKIFSGGKKDEIKNELIDEILEKKLIEQPVATVKGYLQEAKTRRHDLQLYDFTSGDFTEIINRAKARALKKDGPTKKDRYFFQILDWIKRTTGFSYAKLEHETGVPHGFLHKMIQQFSASDDAKQWIVNSMIANGERILKEHYPAFVKVLEKAGIMEPDAKKT